MTWRELLRRALRLFSPRPRTCPNCWDVGTIVDDWWYCGKVLDYKWHCASCGFEKRVVA